LIILILKSRNIEQLLAKSITEYLVPSLSKNDIKNFLENRYNSERYSLYGFIAKNNLKYNICKHINYLLCDIPSLCNVFISYRQYIDYGILYYIIEYNFSLLYIYQISYFQFNIDAKYLYLYIEDWTFIEFDRLNIMIWSDNNGLIMDNYVFSLSEKKYIYYHLYKKCIRPFFRHIYSITY